MSTNESQVNTAVESSSTQTPVILKDNKNYTVLLSDLQRFVDPINQLLKPAKQLNKVNSINDLTQALTKENLRLKDKTIELNPILDEINSITVDFNDESKEEKAKYLGYNSITIKTKPLENKIITMLTPQMLTQTKDGYVIEKSSDDFCGMAQVEIKDIALASNLEYTITPADLIDYTDGAYTLNFNFTGNASNSNGPFSNFPDYIRELYTDSKGNSTVFGAKDLTINVPLVEYHEFTIDAKTLDKTFTPADVPPSLDGTGGNAGKIGFTKIKVKTLFKTPITAETINQDIKDGIIYSVGSDDTESGNDIDGLGIGYPYIEIPPIKDIEIPIVKINELSDSHFNGGTVTLTARNTIPSTQQYLCINDLTDLGHNLTDLCAFTVKVTTDEIETLDFTKGSSNLNLKYNPGVYSSYTINFLSDELYVKHYNNDDEDQITTLTRDTLLANQIISTSDKVGPILNVQKIKLPVSTMHRLTVDLEPDTDDLATVQANINTIQQQHPKTPFVYMFKYPLQHYEMDFTYDLINGGSTNSIFDNALEQLNMSLSQTVDDYFCLSILFTIYTTKDNYNISQLTGTDNKVNSPFSYKPLTSIHKYDTAATTQLDIIIDVYDCTSDTTSDYVRVPLCNNPTYATANLVYNYGDNIRLETANTVLIAKISKEWLHSQASYAYSKPRILISVT